MVGNRSEEVFFNYLILRDHLIPKVINKHADIMTNHVENWLGFTNMTLCDYTPYLFFTHHFQGNPCFVYTLGIVDFTFGYKHMHKPPLMYYIMAFNIADIHPIFEL